MVPWHTYYTIDSNCNFAVSYSAVHILIIIMYLNKAEKKIQGYRKSTEYSVLFQTHSKYTQFMTVGFIPEITAILFEFLAVGTNKLSQRKKPHIENPETNLMEQ